MQITPLGKNILMERLEAPHDNPEAIDSSLLTVSEDNQNFVAARVLATGPGVRRDDGSYAPTGVVAGDVAVVLWGAWSTSPIADGDIGRQRLVLMRDLQGVQE